MDLSNRPRHTHRAFARFARGIGRENGISRSEAMDLMRQNRRMDFEPATAPEPEKNAGTEPANRLQELMEDVQKDAEANAAAGNAVLDQDTDEQIEQESQLIALLARELAQQGEYDYEYSSDLSPSITKSAPACNPHQLIRSLRRMVGPIDPQPAVAGEADGGGQKLPGHARNQPMADDTALADGLVVPRPYEILSRFGSVKIRTRRAPHVESLAGGQRVEAYDNGAEIRKDALGRVVVVKSNLGESLNFHYNGEGDLQSFVRHDQSGRSHSLGEREKHGVVVRDAYGRVRAAGESMTVDPFGCLSVHNHDGQFVSLDLVRGLHIERRRLAQAEGPDSTLTAVFAHDGFRMATRFHESGLDLSAVNGKAQHLARRLGRPFETIRFYGRDGSVIEFSSEEELLALQPKKVLAPGSLHVDVRWRNRRQAGTAWEAVQEYLAIIS